ncbi:hypothetical protein [Legionella parisiensis]|uniref:hypothetical protein n=1 Tax=Legionella parisiensis TaxID=45071 RepID=UPI000730677A|nr:hypothetical protein [Legionella parisiensis]
MPTQFSELQTSKIKRYALRVNPHGHHQHAAIQEEIQWINHILTTTDLIVAAPVKTISQQYFIEIHHQMIPSNRFCLLFEWLPGKKNGKVSTNCMPAS